MGDQNQKPRAQPWRAVYRCHGRDVFTDERGVGIPEPRGMVLQLPNRTKWLLGTTWKMLDARAMYTQVTPVGPANLGAGQLVSWVRDNPAAAASLLITLAGSPEIAMMAATGFFDP